METKNVKSAGKLLAVLECFSSVDKRLSVGEIARRTDLPRSTAHRLILALKEIGFLEQDRSRDEYRLGIKLFELGSIVLNNMDLHREARPFVDALTVATREAAHLCVFDGLRMVFVERSSGGRSGENNATITMESSPCHCTGVGKASLAFQPPAVIDRVIGLGLSAYTRNTITDPDRLRAELEQIRERGYAIDRGEIEIDRNCVAAPIRDSTGKVFAALSCTGPASRMTAERLAEIAPLVVNHADSISWRLGWRRDTGGGEARPRRARTPRTPAALS
ncbi:DNA-binding IclR family transcriptional regulator [Ancylobacter sp. 3268]|uniref:IclR family transcriptional regulator n=1 Tax=Ancylobacter sp. 3268 TaxID=2817752 RepID=UPI002856F1EB|nr:IclR family transcriptional regulator [Ancylobacter sp. 3268]MDR6953244.1 DNA-binding IclR family transcriptional regulator [Ancylobacter sp. 3268]